LINIIKSISIVVLLLFIFPIFYILLIGDVIMVQFIKRPAFSGFETDYDTADYILFGFPMDNTASYRAGSKNMPAFVREASLNIETNSLFSGNDMAHILLHDLGDIIVSARQHDRQINEAQEIIQSIREANKVPVMIGGEHSITEAVIDSFSDSLFVVLDAHTDLRSEYLGDDDSHACVCYKIANRLDPDQLLQIGIRGLSPEEIQFASEHDISQITSLQILQSDVDSIITKINKKIEAYDSIYLSFDMDVYDPAYAPGVGTPEPLGLSPLLAFKIIHGIKKEIKGIDINEMTPNYDPSGVTSILAAKTLQEILLR